MRNAMNVAEKVQDGMQLIGAYGKAADELDRVHGPEINSKLSALSK